MDPLPEAAPLLLHWGSGAAILVLLLVAALLSGSETALTTASRGKLHAMADKGERGAAGALALTEDRERLLGAILLGSTLVRILATALATALAIRLLGGGAVLAATLAMTALVLIFSEVVPRAYAVTAPEATARRAAGVLRPLVAVLSPVVSLARALARLLLGVFGVATDPKASFLAAKEEIAGAIVLGHSEGLVEKADRDRLLGALDLRQRQVEEVMMHRRDIEMIDAEADPAEILEQAINSPHTRIPIFRGEPENIVGVIHAKDLSRAVHRYVQETRGDEGGRPHGSVAGSVRDEGAGPDGGPQPLTPQQENGDGDTGRRPHRRDLFGHDGDPEPEVRGRDIGDGRNQADADRPDGVVDGAAVV